MAAPTKTSFTIGTRKSALALAQTHLVLEAIKTAYPDYEFKVFSQETAGDLNTVMPLKDFTTKNLWTEELEQHMIAGHVDFIAHSLKDVPTLLPPTCALGPTIAREDSRDVLVVKQGLPYKSLAELPAGSVVGTSSVRRSAQLARKYPHLKVENVRGNIGTRLSKLDAEGSPFTCIILAAAGLLRLDLGDRITQYLDWKNSGWLYAVGQGAIGIEIRADDTVLLEMLKKVEDRETTFAILAERSLLRTLEGGCSAPLGVESEWVQTPEGKKLRMRSIVVSVDGKDCAEVVLDGDVDSADKAEGFGVTVANALVADGAGAILEVIQQEKQSKENLAV